MRRQFILSALLFSFPFLVFSQNQPDEPDNDGPYGYSSIDYDPSTNQITAYSETDILMEPY